MFNKKLLVLSLAVCLGGISTANAKLDLSDLTVPKDPAYRVGISEIPENQYVEVKKDYTQDDSEIGANDMADGNTTDVSYADLSLKRLSREISQDLVSEENDMVSDLSLLWQGAAMQSDTINFALYKLANPDADKPQKSTVKNMLKTIASMSTLAGATMANPLLAGTSLISGNVLGIMSQDTKELNYKYTKVTDADMIILIRKVEDLQQNAVNLYYDYMTAKKQLELATDVVKERGKRYEAANKNDAARELIVVTDAYYRTALDRQKNAKAEFLSKRAALEQFVGNEAFTQFEKELFQRENENKKSLNSEETNAYNETIRGVEEYTSNIATGYGADSNEPEYYADPNLNKMPDLAPLNYEQKTTVPEQVEETPEIQEEQPQTPSKKTKKTKEDKYSTKGLIFIHNEQPKAVEQTSEVQETKTKKNKSKNKKEPPVEVEFKTQSPVEAPVEAPVNKLNKFNGVELLPLDDLKAPNFYQSKSIFRE